MKKQYVFKFCPSCGSESIKYDNLKCYECANCGWIYYHNNAAAVACILLYGSKIVLIKRGAEPGKGKIDLPGGFVDPGESAEDALRRELKEELNIDIKDIEYFGSYPNKYEYNGIIYPTCDLFFISKIDHISDKYCKKEIEEIVLTDPFIIELDNIAFMSTKTALTDFRDKYS